MKKVYFDNAATTPIAPEVVEAMIPVLKEQFGNPSSIHALGRSTRAIIETSRKSVAKLLNATPAEIFFTSGGTEADNMAIYGSINDLGVTRIITSPIEHHAVLHTAEHIAQHYPHVKMELVNLLPNGDVDLVHLEKLLTESDAKTLVSLMHANNEVGNLLPLKQVGNLCRQYNALFHSDTVQTMGHYRFDLQDLPIDFLTCAAHKFHGPKGVGFLYIHHQVKIKPFIWGGAQERNMRGGTENVYGIVGLSKALELAYEELDEHELYIRSLKQYFIQRLKEILPDVSFNGASGEESLYTVLNVCFPATSNAEMLLFNLDIQGVCASGGSACSSGSNVGSHVLRALNTDMTRPSVRFSFSRYNTKDEIDFVMEKLMKLFKIENSATA
jgi:cysteine desulfurase